MIHGTSAQILKIVQSPRSAQTRHKTRKEAVLQNQVCKRRCSVGLKGNRQRNQSPFFDTLGWSALSKHNVASRSTFTFLEPFQLLGEPPHNFQPRGLDRPALALGQCPGRSGAARPASTRCSWPHVMANRLLPARQTIQGKLHLGANCNLLGLCGGPS